jgi:riboflavin kinase/FMN adenylyltransferase
MATHWIDWHQTPPECCRAGVATIGNYDGVHRGHEALLLQIVLQGRALQAPSVVVTFEPHPLELLRPEAAPPRLTTPADRADLLHAAGVGQVVVLRTTPDLLSLEPEAFFEAVLVRGHRARALVEGSNFAFGHRRRGTIDTLADLCRQHGLALTVVPRQHLATEAISSTAIRQALADGDVVRAAHLLGRPYRLTGRVVPGAQRGRTLGFPTANLADIATLIPRDGVYAVRVWVGGDPWPGAANIGPNPTFGEAARTVEVHLIDYPGGDLSGTTPSLDFVARLRDTRPFASVEDLLAQLRQDIDTARAMTTPGGTR